jgi:hypothetical protein
MARKKTETEATAPVKKTPTRRRATKQVAPIELTWDYVATRAYYIHLETGGDPTENWLRAERELIAA